VAMTSQKKPTDAEMKISDFPRAHNIYLPAILEKQDLFFIRHGERPDFVWSGWTRDAFPLVSKQRIEVSDTGEKKIIKEQTVLYNRFDLNLPDQYIRSHLPLREVNHYAHDPPLTEAGHAQAALLGRALTHRLTHAFVPSKTSPQSVTHTITAPPSTFVPPPLQKTTSSPLLDRPLNRTSSGTFLLSNNTPGSSSVQSPMVSGSVFFPDPSSSSSSTSSPQTSTSFLSTPHSKTNSSPPPEGKTKVPLIFSSPALRCVQTAAEIANTFSKATNTEVKVRVEFGLFEWMGHLNEWAPLPGGKPQWLTPASLATNDLPVDTTYESLHPFPSLQETHLEYFQRSIKVLFAIFHYARAFNKENTNDPLPILLIAHSQSLDTLSCILPLYSYHPISSHLLSFPQLSSSSLDWNHHFSEEHLKKGPRKAFGCGRTWCATAWLRFEHGTWQTQRDEDSLQNHYSVSHNWSFRRTYDDAYRKDYQSFVGFSTGFKINEGDNSRKESF